MIKLLVEKLQPSSFQKFYNYLFVVVIYCFLVLVFSGCGTVAIINKNESDLMPKSVAMSIFEKYGFKEWADKPFVSSAGFCGTEKVYISFNDINSATYRTKTNELIFINNPQNESLCLQRAVLFKKLTESQALELANAARALGATKIDKLQWNY